MAWSNASSRTVMRIFGCVEDGRWEEAKSLHHPSFWCEDRRPGLRGRTTLRGQLANLRAIRSLGSFEVEEECLQILGENLSLCRYVFRGRDDSPFEIEFLSVNEVDDSGLMANYVVFDPSDIEEALTELNSRSNPPR